MTVGRELRARHWDQQKQAGIDLLPVGDFAWYDHVLTMICCWVMFRTSSEQRRFGRYRLPCSVLVVDMRRLANLRQHGNDQMV
ncbi:hypothetical protein OHD60_12980 [Escherichia coli]|nr:hypothetical protein [Escherichia coli]